MDRWQKALIYYGAFGTTWNLLRDFGLQAFAVLLLVAFFAGVLFGLRMNAMARKRRSTSEAALDTVKGTTAAAKCPRRDSNPRRAA